jgi:PAS domain S-box-containing protein
LNILIVDDDARHSDSVRDVLAAHNYPTADTATSGQEGLDLLRSRARTPEAYHVLILDLHIPDLGGVDILRAIKEDEIAVKTIVLSGEKSLDTVTPILQLGAFDYIQKPFAAHQLITSVANALARQQLELENASMHRDAEENAELYGFLLNASPDMVYMLDEAGRFKYINHQLDGVFNTEVQSLKARSWDSLFAGHEEVTQRLGHHFNERRTGLRATVAEQFEYASDIGTTHTLELSSIGLYEGDEDNRVFIGTYGVLRDVTEARRTRQQLEQSQRKFYSLFAESPDAVFIAHINSGKIIERNANFIQMRQLLPGEDDGTDQFLWTTESPREHFIAGLEANADHYDLTLTKQVNGKDTYFEIRGRKLDIEGEPCMLATLRDRTPERRAEQDRLALEQQLHQAGRMEAIGQVAGGIAHDFNNILASIIGYAELILTARNRLGDEQVNDYLDEVVTAGHRARDLISQMLTFTRAKRGKASPVDITTTIMDVSRMLRAAIPSTIEVQTGFSKDLPLVFVDPVQIQQVIINLLINARDAIKGTGQIVIDVRNADSSAPCQTCGEVLSSAHVVISVKDTGHGIPADILDKIFEMYFTTRPPEQGTGFGLWLINNLVHEHQGHISVSSVVGQGTEFQIHLPTANAVDGDDIISTIPVPKIPGRIVVVDDEVSVANFIGEVLRDQGYPTVVFTESPQALDYLEHHMDDIALLLTDGSMPLISGIELVEYCRKTKPNLPIIFITAFTQQIDTQALHKLKVNTFLQKPFSIDEMLKAVADHVLIDD